MPALTYLSMKASRGELELTGSEMCMMIVAGIMISILIYTIIDRKKGKRK